MSFGRESTMLPIESHMVFNTVIPCIEDGRAELIPGASFRDGMEDEYVVDFYWLWGRAIRSENNRRTTRTKYEFVGDGWELDQLRRMAGK